MFLSQDNNLISTPYIISKFTNIFIIILPKNKGIKPSISREKSAI